MGCREVKVQFEHRFEGGERARLEGGGEHCRQLKQTIATASLRITKEATVFIKQREWGREETGVRVGGRSCKGTTSNSADSGLYPE